MTDKTIFGKESLVLAPTLGSEITEGYVSVRNLYVAANDQDASSWYVDTLKEMAYGDGGLGDAQNQATSPKVADFEPGSSDFPTVESEHGVLPEGIPVDPDDPKEAIQDLQMLLREWFAEAPEVVADGQGRSKLKQRREQKSDEPEKDEPEQDDETDLTDFENALTELYGIGESNVSEVAEQLHSDPQLVDELLGHMDSVVSYETAEVDPLEAAFSGDSLQDAKDLREETSFSDERIIEIVA